MKWMHCLIITAVMVFSLFSLFNHQEYGLASVLLATTAILVFFSGVSWQLHRKKSAMALEISQRTVTWWWMIAVFALALSIHRIVSFVFLAFLCFTALREFYSLVPMKQDGTNTSIEYNDRLPIIFSYVSIILVTYLAYIKWYDFFIILIPVYLFLFIPVIFVIQNRTTHVVQSMGYIVLGFMFFVYNFGHCLFLINLGAMVLMFCFALTEIRDVLSFWIGKYFSDISRNGNTFWHRLAALKIAPDVSPNKTYCAALIAALMTAIIALVFVPFMPAMNGVRISVLFALTSGFLIGMLGQIGDLVFSMIKRDAGCKDSGSLLPGHGGIIDRVDSLIFTIPVTFHLIYWWYF